MYRFSKRSLKNLEGVNVLLKMVAIRALAISSIDFVVIEGVRNRRRQERLVATGASKTMNSRHLTGHAIDVVPWVDGEINWAWPHYHVIADAFKQAAHELQVDVDWGGDWLTLKDGPHFELNRARYPAAKDRPKRVVKKKTKGAKKTRANKKPTTKEVA